MRFRTLKLFAFSYLFILVGLGFGDEVTVEISFNEQDLRFDRLSNFDLVDMRGCDFLDIVGKPMLPIKNIHVALPQGMKVEEIRVEDVRKEKISGRYRIYPAQPPRPIYGAHENFQLIEPDSSTYNSSSLYPGYPAEFIGTGRMAGHWIAGLKIFPIQYNPAESTLVFCRYLKLTLALSESGELPIIRKRTKSTEELISKAVKNLVVNPWDVAESVAEEVTETPLQDGIVEYLIIAHSNYSSYFEGLAGWKTTKGVPAQILTTDWIYGNYEGADYQEKIRNCIKDYVLTHGTVWVLLGGDINRVPYRGCYGWVNAAGGPVEDDNIPCDLYYAELDADWDADEDGIWGEVEDIGSQLYPDVWIGRAPVDNPSEASLFANKILTYEIQPPTDYQLDMLFMAEKADPWTDDAVLKNTIDDESIPPRFDPITKLYESSGNLSRGAAISAMNAGCGFINHAGHGNTTVMSIGDDYLSNSDMYGLTNSPKYSILYSLGCYCGSFDSDCILEQFVLSPDGGGFTVGNSRYGWYTSGSPGQGASDRYERRFWHELFDENEYRLGQAFGESKAYYISASGNLNAWRWCQFCLNLLGDPEMPLWTDEPIPLNVTHPDTIPLGPNSFTVTVDDGDPVQYATVCVMKEGEVYETGLTNSSGTATLNITLQSAGDPLWVTVTAQNHLPYQNIVLVDPSPIVQFTADSTEGQAPFSVHFYDESFGTIDTWHWEFGDGDTSWSQNPIHTYNTPGHFNVSLMVSGPFGSDTMSKTDYIIVRADTIMVENCFATPGQTGKVVRIIGTNSDSLEGYSVALYFDTDVFEVDTLTLEGTCGEDPFLNLWGWDNDIGYLTAGIVWTVSPPWIPPGKHPVLNIVFNVKEDAPFGPTTLNLDNGVGTGDADNTFLTWRDEEIFPILVDGTVQIGEEAEFIRGDVNNDNIVGSPDAIFILRYVFVPGSPTPSCMDAADANDDGSIGMLDGVYILKYKFVPGHPPPPLPYPDCGSDPTEDGLECGWHPCGSSP